MPLVLGYQGANDFRLLRTAESPADVVRFWSQRASDNGHESSHR
jgi:hypothetical protein